MKMPKPSPETVAWFDGVVPTGAGGVERRQMFGQPSAFVNGNMFMGLFGDEMILRLPPEDREQMAGLGGGPFEPMGRPMKEYVTLAPAVRGDEAALEQWVSRSLAFASQLPAKAPKAKKR
ncbi:MAG TPA: TfoX/Sxy family protein [Gaiellales bacterium]|jgi:TfoX/Sxy family transcriptional regulator of competence genes|nr:TfoX/Sxy family protein [Gaiellales bacterium]